MTGERSRPISTEISRSGSSRPNQHNRIASDVAKDSKAELTGRAYQFHPEQWSDMSGPPPISGGSEENNLGFYFAGYLRKRHPKWSEEKISEAIQRASQDPDQGALLQAFERLSQMLKDNPELLAKMREVVPEDPTLPD